MKVHTFLFRSQSNRIVLLMQVADDLRSAVPHPSVPDPPKPLTVSAPFTIFLCATSAMHIVARYGWGLVSPLCRCCATVFFTTMSSN